MMISQRSGCHMPTDLVNAINATLISPNEADQNLEPANVVDGLFAIARAIHDVAEAIRETKPHAD
jgi:hypothetical protein